MNTYNSLIDIVHAGSNALTLASKLSDGENHLIKTDIAIVIPVEAGKALFSLSTAVGTKNLDQVISVKSISAFDDERHPQTPRKGFRRWDLLKSLDNDRVSRIGVENMLASNLMGDVTEY